MKSVKPTSCEVTESVRKGENAAMRGSAANGSQMLAGRRLRAARKALGLTQAQAAEDLHTSNNNLSMWESGHRGIDPYKASRFVERYGLTLDWLFRGDPSGVRNDLAPRLLIELGKLSEASAALAANPERPAARRHTGKSRHTVHHLPRRA